MEKEKIACQKTKTKREKRHPKVSRKEEMGKMGERN